MNSNLAFYCENTASLVAQYNSVSFKTVHKDWLHLLPNKGRALDIGAGSGRDARYLTELGLTVYAAEPALPLLLSAKEHSKDHDIVWYQDTLPHLTETLRLKQQFDLILLSAVWMHLSPPQRSVSIKSMALLLANNGRLVITLRHGGFSDARTAFPVEVEEVVKLAEQNGLAVLLKTALTSDKLGRECVAWQTLVLTN